MNGTVGAASLADCEALEKLVDRAYRQRIAGAWTTEEGRVVGQRITAQGIRALLDDPDAELFVARGYSAPGSLDGCILLHYPHGAGIPELGLFAVEPTVQGAGIGRALVQALEAAARERGHTAVRLMVLDDRPELTAWYERLGYAATGVLGAFPTDTPSTPVDPNVRFLEFRKDFS